MDNQILLLIISFLLGIICGYKLLELMYEAEEEPTLKDFNDLLEAKLKKQKEDKLINRPPKVKPSPNPKKN